MQILNSPKLDTLTAFLSAQDPAAAETLSRLSDAGELEPSLCFLAEDNGRPAGALVLVPARSGEVKTAFAACAVCKDEHTLSQLWFLAFDSLRQQGFSYAFARFSDGEKKIYYDHLKWEWIVSLGFVPPVLDESALSFGGKRLDDSARPSCLPLQLPKALNIPSPEAIFHGDNMVSEQEVEKQIYTARDRRRLAERAALIIFIIAVCAVGVTRATLPSFLRILPLLGGGMYLLFLNIYRPRKLTAEVMSARKKKGRNGADEKYFFGEDRFIFFSDGHGSAITSYDNIIAVYNKPDFLFLCSRSGTKSAGGWFVRKASLSDCQAFLEHIRQKSPNAVFRK